MIPKSKSNDSQKSTHTNLEESDSLSDDAPAGSRKTGTSTLIPLI